MSCLALPCLALFSLVLPPRLVSSCLTLPFHTWPYLALSHLCLSLCSFVEGHYIVDVGGKETAKNSPNGVAQQMCPLGSYCVGGTKTLCSTTGDYCPEGSAASRPCAKGHFCTSPSSQVKCPKGSYCKQGRASPQSLTPGHFAVTKGDPDVADPDDPFRGLSGMNGTYTFTGGEDEMICPLGSYCDNNGTIVACVPGQPASPFVSVRVWLLSCLFRTSTRNSSS